MSDYIPEELLIDIFARLPVKSLIRLRLVCKSWYSLISKPSFITTHLNRTKKSNTTLPQLLIKCESAYQQYYLSCFDDETFGVKYEELESPFDISVKFFDILGSCNGLCLLKASCEVDFFLWNPSIKKILTLPPIKVTTFSDHSFTDGVAVGFGFDQNSNDYKVVLIRYLFRSISLRYVCQGVELYELSTHSWRSIHGVGCFRYEIFRNTPYVFLNGAVHWVASVRRLTAFMVVAFDMSGQVFREMALPNRLVRGSPNHVFIGSPCEMMRVAILGESLAVIQSELDINPRTFHIWVMEEYGVVESWTKRSTIVLQGEFWRVVGLRKNGDVLMVAEGEGDNELVLCDSQSQQIRHLGVRGYHYCFQVVTYIESLVGLDGTVTVANKKASRRKRECCCWIWG